MKCVTLKKTPEEDRADYWFNWEYELAHYWRGAAEFQAGQYVLPEIDTGFEYECTTPGRTAAVAPRIWPSKTGETVEDGTVVWTARPFGGLAIDDVTDSQVVIVSNSPGFTIATPLPAFQNGLQQFYLEGAGTVGEIIQIRNLIDVQRDLTVPRTMDLWVEIIEQHPECEA